MVDGTDRVRSLTRRPNCLFWCKILERGPNDNPEGRKPLTAVKPRGAGPLVLPTPLSRPVGYRINGKERVANFIS